MSAERQVIGIILAGGLSRRCPEGKLFLPWGEGTVLAATLDHLLDAGPSRTLVVSGHQAQKIQELLVGSPARVVFNPDYRQGMGTSVAAGISAALAWPEFSPEGGILLLPADTPFIPVATLAAAITAYQEGQGEIVVASHARRRGHPVIFHRRFAPELRTACLEGEGARQVVRAHAVEVYHLEAGPEVLEDIDTSEDYRRLIAKFQISNPK